MFCKKCQISSHVTVCLVGVARIADDRAAPLHINNAIADTQRRDITASVVLLILRRYVRRLDRLGSRNRPCVSIGENHQIVAHIHMRNRIRLPREQISGDGTVIRHRT